jgi:hypothetical protein
MWAAIAERGWNDARLAAETGIDVPSMTRLLYGDRTANRKQAVRLYEVIGVPFSAWDETCSARTRKHSIPEEEAR